MSKGVLNRTNTMGLRGRALRWTITACATTAFSLFGYDQGLMSGIITAPQFARDFPGVVATRKEDEYHATIVQGATTACYEIGCLVGAIWVLAFGERVGRRPIVLIGCFIIVIGTVITITAIPHKWPLGHFIVGRSITGIGNGMNTATVPVWQSEMSKPKNRGKLVNLEGSVVAFGTMIAYWIDFGLSYANSSVSWRLPIALQIVFAVLVFIIILGLPDSPKWLIKKNRNQEAIYIMSCLFEVDPNDPELLEEVDYIAETVKLSEKSGNSYRDLFTGGKTQHFQRMCIGASTQFFQQFTGCNAAIYYSTVLFETTIFPDKENKRRLSLILGGVFSIVYAVFTLPSFFLVDTFGRRNLFLMGAIGQGVSFIITMACLIHPTANNSKGAAVGLYLYIVFFAMSILPLPWIYPPEINPLKTRTRASAVSTCTNWLCNAAVVLFTPIFIGKSDWGCYLFFACMNFLFVPVIFFFYPETAGRSLEEIDVIFAKAHEEKRQPWRVAATMPKLSMHEVEQEAQRLGIYGDDQMSIIKRTVLHVSRVSSTNGESSLAEKV
ncbi:sugar porter family MFS transporter [Kocuria palustris]|nr:sugar porter family MFS transporter [Kocuria palustris]